TAGLRVLARFVSPAPTIRNRNMKQLPQKARFGDARETLRRPGEGWRGFLRRLAEHSGAMPCGGARACGKCAVQLLPPEAAPSPSPDDMRLLGTERVRQG
ncbi:MAG TPA: hypothetical protein PLO53_11020, partial [Candidatus Hydrogenedentes bacterium]|nr:hypothetical protein [Candidatus Hydrogenedentota bacterium]